MSRSAAALRFTSLSLGMTATAAIRAASPVDISSELGAILPRHQIPGMTAVALRGPAIVAQGAAGLRVANATGPVTLDDKFHLGSDTKAMTATVAAMLVEEGKLRWQTTLREAFGTEVPEMRPEWDHVTLLQVLCHRAGLPANPADALKRRVTGIESPLSEQRRKLVVDLLTHPPETPLGAKYLYSNYDYILAGALIEKIEGLPWEDVTRDRLFQPLGITSGGFGAPGSTLQIDQPRGHHVDGTPAAAGADNPAFYGPAGTAHMNIADWARFIALHLRGDSANPHAEAKLLNPATFAALHAPPFGGDYACGWIVTTRPWAKGDRPNDTGRTLTHSGSNTMWYCTAWIAPEIDFAALVACNRGGDEAAKACDEAIAAMIGKFAPKPASH